jgi:OOP family OmpA-OmpF porin
MTESARNRPEDPAEEPGGGARRDRPLEELRELILGPFRDRLDRLQHQVNHPPELRPGEVGRVLPQAVSQSSARDKKLALALEPITENAIRASIRRNRQVLVDVLFPVIGPAIRKAIAVALQGMIQSFNQVLEHSLSLRGLKWRLEALRTGRPFAEVVLLHTLLYEVEYVFLIHRPTGLMLQHAFARSSLSLDPDLISGMLTAIRDFVQDSFGAGKEDALDALRVGERSVWIQQGPRALLAAAIRGNPPPELRTLLAEALDEIHFRHEAALDAFDGDPAAFEQVRPVLESCLQVRLLPSAKRRKSIGVWLVVAALLLAAGWGGFRLVDDRWRWSHFMSELRARPGIVVTAVEEKGGRRHVYGLRDPYAPEPLELLGPTGIRPESVVFHWEALQSSHPEYARRRVEAVFSPPPTVRLTFADGVLKAEGAARSPWIADARRLAKALPGIDTYDEAGLVDIDERLHPPPGARLALDGRILHASGNAPSRWIAEARAAAPAIPGIAAYRDGELVATESRELDQLKLKIESAVFFFEPGRRDPAPGQGPVLRDLEQAALQLAALAKELDQPLGIEIVGHSDSSGTKDLNMRISYDRAQYMRDRLVSAGVPEGRLKVRAAGSSQPLNPGAAKQDRAVNRRVTFEVNLSGS